MDQYRHTEIQVQALHNAWNIAAAGNEKNCLEALLPTQLLSPTPQNISLLVYSLFEVCHACEKTAWLQRRKDHFYFKVLDAQYTRSGKYKANGFLFMKQSDLENTPFSNNKTFKDVAQEACLNNTCPQEITAYLQDTNNGFTKLN